MPTHARMPGLASSTQSVLRTARQLLHLRRPLGEALLGMTMSLHACTRGCSLPALPPLATHLNAGRLFHPALIGRGSGLCSKERSGWVVTSMQRLSSHFATHLPQIF